MLGEWLRDVMVPGASEDASGKVRVPDNMDPFARVAAKIVAAEEMSRLEVGNQEREAMRSLAADPEWAALCLDTIVQHSEGSARLGLAYAELEARVALQTLSQYLPHRHAAVAAERAAFVRIKAAENFAPFKVVKYIDFLCNRESALRQKGYAAEDAEFASILKAASEAAERDRRRWADFEMDETDARAAVKAQESMMFGTLADAAHHAERSLLLRSGLQGVEEEEAVLRAGIADEAFAQLEASAFKCHAAAILLAATKAMGTVRKEETLAYTTLIATFSDSRDRIAVEAMEAEERGKREAGLVLMSEERARETLVTQESLEAEDITSLGSLLLTACEEEAQAARNQQLMHLARECRELERVESNVRATVHKDEELGWNVVEEAEYVGRSEALIDERRRMVRVDKATRVCTISESRQRSRIQDDEASSFAQMQGALHRFLDTYTGWREHMDDELVCLQDTESDARIDIAGEADVCLALLRLDLSEGVARDVYTSSHWTAFGVYVDIMQMQEETHRQQLVSYDWECAVTALTSRRCELDVRAVGEQLVNTVSNETDQRQRCSEEEAIFRASLNYRLHCAPDEAHRAPSSSAPPLQPPPALDTLDASGTLEAGGGWGEAGGDLPSTPHSCQDSPLAATTNPAQPRSASAQGAPSPVWTQDEAFQLQVLIDTSGGSGMTFEVGEHATVETATDLLAKRCRSSSSGWAEDKARCAGQTGLVCQVNYDSALLLFSDGRQQWLPQQALCMPNQSALLSAPQELPGSAAVEISRSLFRTYLNTVLPGGDHADLTNIFTYVLLPLGMLCSALFLMFYRYQSAI